MASDENMSTTHSSVFSSMQDIDVDGYLGDGYTEDDAGQDGVYDDEDEYDDGEGDEDQVDMGIQMSRLSLETSEGVDDNELEPSDCDDEEEDENGGATNWDLAGGVSYLSFPGTPSRRPSGPAPSAWTKKYASETEVGPCLHGCRTRKKSGGGDDRSSFSSSSSSSSSDYHNRRPGRTRERRLDRAWEMRRSQVWAAGGHDSHSGGSCSPCVVVRAKGPGTGCCMWMDMEEVKACRDLGLELPSDWTVEIPPGAFTAASTVADTIAGGHCPVGNWHISSHGEDPRDIKARLRLWAQAVALTTASRLSS